MELGDIAIPTTPGSGGSFGAASCRLGRAHAGMTCAKLEGARLADGGRRRPDGAVGRPPASPLTASRPRADARARSRYKKYSQYAYGAHFAEVGVDADTGEVRLRRMLGVFAAGRILNAKTARSQLIGGMIWGVGSALHEERRGRSALRRLRQPATWPSYHVPVHADIRESRPIFLDELDDKANPLGSKGVGELGICGAGAAVANAVYNACGVRVRDYPITLDKVLPALMRRQG